VIVEDEINTCNYLFLTDIRELGRNRLKLFLSEGCPAGEVERIVIGDQSIAGGTRIDITANSRIFEMVWTSYVAYSVINESYASSSGPEERFEGRLFRIYSESRFLDYAALSTFATSEYPGPMKHYQICCEDHVLNVISTQPPSICRPLGNVG
jgi:hypothetical protein